MDNQNNNTHHALIEIVGATCTSCSFAIEHMGEKLNGIQDIWVDRANSCIHVNYDGDKSLLEQICAFVQKIGYQASITES